MTDVTRLLDAAHRGDRQAAAELLPLVYDELLKLALTHAVCNLVLSVERVREIWFSVSTRRKLWGRAGEGRLARSPLAIPRRTSPAKFSSKNESVLALHENIVVASVAMQPAALFCACLTPGSQ
jgi:hypothetical protein